MLQSQSTITLQKIVNLVSSFGDVEPVLNKAGQSSSPALIIATDVMNAICSVNFPHKFNEFALPYFYTNSWQQDYALIYTAQTAPSGWSALSSFGSSLYGEGLYGIGPYGAANIYPSVLNLAWLERGICIDINNTSFPKPYREVEVGRQLPAATGANWNLSGGGGGGNPLFLVNFFPNINLYYGTWGETNNGTSSIGNNPVTGSVYTNPLGTGSMPDNPITQIQDGNGNLLVLTTYGQEGSAAPILPPNSTAGTNVSGTGASTIWSVVDPYGSGIRVYPVVSQTGSVWQFQLTGQMKPVRFTSLSQTLFPLPDEFEPNFRAGFIAQCYRYSPDSKVRGKFKDEWQLWLASLNDLRAKQDRELEENEFVPDRTILGGSANRVRQWRGPSWPYNY